MQILTSEHFSTRYLITFLSNTVLIWRCFIYIEPPRPVFIDRMDQEFSESEETRATERLSPIEQLPGTPGCF